MALSFKIPLDIGADALLVVKNSDICDVEMVYYNSDGSRGDMCGNGLRCFVKFVYDNNIVRKEDKIITNKKDINKNDIIDINMQDGIIKTKVIEIGE